MQNTIKENSNFLFIDYAKFIGIFLVIFQHALGRLHLTNNISFQHLEEIIALFHMPLFFIISGFLYKQKDNGSNLKKILYGLLIPYCLYQIIYFPFQYCSYIIHQHYALIPTFFKCVAGIICGDGVSSKFSLYTCAPCWFIVSIIHIRLICNYLNLNKKNIIIAVILAIFIFKILIIYNLDLFFCIDNTIMAIPYFFTGYIIRQIFRNKYNQTNENFSQSKIKLFLYILISLIILIIIYKYNGVILMNLRINKNLQGQSIILSYIAGIVGTFAVICISKLFNANHKILDVISKNTLFIIFYHWLILWLISLCKIYILVNLVNSMVLRLVLCVFISIIILLLNYISIVFLEKYFPIILGKQMKYYESKRC